MSVRCLSCGYDNPPEARFCAKCGITLVTVTELYAPEALQCNICGQYNPSEAHFCANCGATLTSTVKPPSPPAPRLLTRLRKGLLFGALAILLIIIIGFGITSLWNGIRKVPSTPPPPPTTTPIPAPISPPEIATPPLTKGEVLFFEDFENGLQKWILFDKTGAPLQEGEGWQLERTGDNTILKGTGHNWVTLEDKAWDDYAFETRFKLIKGHLHFNYRLTESGRYFIGVSRSGIYLDKQIGDNSYDIIDAPLQLDEGWHELEIMGYENTINVYIDDTLLIAYNDDNPILSGGIAFETLEDSEFIIDDVRITETSPPMIYVDRNYTGLGIGTKERPFTTIQEGIDRSYGFVWVAAGVYREVVDLKDNLVLLGAGADKTFIYGNVMVNDVTGAKICGFTITDDDTAGIHCYHSSLTIANNIIINQPHDGIFVSSNSSLAIINNVITDNSHNGIFLSNSSEAKIRNNIIVDNGDCGVAMVESSSCFLDYNNIWHNLRGNYGDNVVPGMHDLPAEPLFIDVAGRNFRLQPDSPCINAGDPDPQYNDADGSRNDIGTFGGPAECALGF